MGPIAALSRGYTVSQPALPRMSTPESASGVDATRVLALRRQIFEGTYLTDDKLDIVAERLNSLLGPEPREIRLTG